MNELLKHKNVNDNYRPTKVLYHQSSFKVSHEKFVVPWQMDDYNKHREKAKQ